MNDNKSYYKITGMSESFREWDDETIDYIKTTGQEVPFEMMVRFWELRFQLTIAQQLSIISVHLAKIVEGSEALRKQNGE